MPLKIKGFGYSDVENNLKAHEDTVMRIASISKPITCAVAAKLFENGQLGFDKSVNEYLKTLPTFKWNNLEVCNQAFDLKNAKN